jgi:MFS family permease
VEPSEPFPAPAGTAGRRFGELALALAVAVAFADSSVVVLALPDLYRDLDTTIVGVSWVITAYNLAVALATPVVLPLVRRRSGRELLVAGTVVFAAASLACGLVDDLAALVAARVVQGAGGALLLTAALPALVRAGGSVRRGVTVWSTAALAGLALGPATGGVLTAALDWRAIFLAQVPTTLVALAALGVVPARLRLEQHRPAGRGRGQAPASLGLALLSASLVGALFLAVLLVVTVWDLGPLRGAGVVSSLPAGAVVARLLAQPPEWVAALLGPGLLACGLGALALLPASSAVYVVPALMLCGLGIGVAVPLLTGRTLGDGQRIIRDAALSVGIRHAGLVVGLVLVAPLLSRELERGGDRAIAGATASILDADLNLTTKVPIALDLRDAFVAAQSGVMPDLEQPFAERGAGSDERVTRARDDLREAIRAPLTRSFRPAFALAALFAALVAPIALLAVRRRR